MDTSAPVIRLQEFSKQFGLVTAVDRISVDFEEGEFFALLGPSGCGKTTLLRMIAGFETPSAGRMFLGTDDVTDLRPNRRPVNLMFQSYALFPHMSVRGNVAYGLEMERLPRADIRRRVDEVLEMAKLSELADRKPDRLSGGQKQRVALARALVKRPRVLLLDEPLAALDKKLRQEMQLELKRLQHEVGITFVVVTHDQEEALVMADRIALMRAGRIEQLGDPKTLYEQPATRFVADFIGVANFFDGTVAEGGILAPPHGVLRGTVPGELSQGDSATLTVRPERIFLKTDKPSEADNAVRGEVIDLAYHGSDVSVHLSVANITRQLVVRLSGEEIYRPGQSVWCCWNPAHARILA
jgi:spermidine/putrescine ABC transporter ATP-binding subunit